MTPPDRSRTLLGLLVVTVLLAGLATVAGQGRTAVPATGDAALEETAGAAGPAPDEQLAPTTAEQDRQAQLVEAEDDRLLSIVGDRPPGDTPYEVGAGRAMPTVVLTARSRPYDLPALERLGAAEEQDDGTWLLTRSVLVGRDAELRIQEPGSTLRLASGPDGFVSLIAFKGALTLSGGPAAPLAVTSWNPVTRAPDADPTDGRAYVRVVGGRMDLTRVDASALGFWSGRTGGVAWTGSSGEPATGSATESAVSGGHYGIFTSDVTGLTLDATAVRANELDGLLLHRDTDGVTARGVSATGNGRDGIAVAKGARNVTLTGVTAEGNRGNGIRIDGSPLASSATAGGASTAAGSGYTVERSTVTGNGEVGVLATEADGLRLAGNTVSGSRDGIVVRGATERPELDGNRVDAGAFGIAVRHGTVDARLTGNEVGSAVIGIQVLDASADLTRNSVAAASRYGVSLVGEVSGSSVNANRFAGRGLAPVDVNRVALTATADLGANDESGWVTDRDEIRYWLDYASSHPLVLMWLLILLLPITAQLWSRRRNRAEPEHPYAHAAPRPATARPDPAPAPRPRVAPVDDPVGHTVVITSLRRPAPRGPSRPADDVSATAVLPVTRVTVVSGEGART